MHALDSFVGKLVEQVAAHVEAHRHAHGRVGADETKAGEERVDVGADENANGVAPEHGQAHAHEQEQENGVEFGFVRVGCRVQIRQYVHEIVLFILQRQRDLIFCVYNINIK